MSGRPEKARSAFSLMATSGVIGRYRSGGGRFSVMLEEMATRAPSFRMTPVGVSSGGEIKSTAPMTASIRAAQKAERIKTRRRRSIRRH